MVVVLLVLLLELGPRELLATWTLREPSEKECKSRVEEEFVSYLLVIVVHWLSSHLVQPLEVVEASILRFVRSVEVDKHRKHLFEMRDCESIFFIVISVISESREMKVHDLFTDSLEPSSVPWEKRATLLVPWEFRGQQASHPVLEGPKEDLLSDLGDDFLFLTLRRGLRSLLFFNLNF